MEFSEYTPGTFCWPELCTTDSAAAKTFYSAIFGWDLHDDPIGPDAVYTMASKGGKNVGAMYQRSPEQEKVGIPPHWLSYVSVEDVDSSHAKAKTLGAATMVDPMDVMDIGRMAVMADPTGAAFAMWQPKKRIGSQLANEPGTMTWHELLTHDVDKSGEFFTDLFGWKSKAMDMGGMVYTQFINGDKPAGGMLKIQPEWGETPSNWVIYFAVEDCDASLAKITELGGREISPAQDIPGMGRFAMVQDPQGAVFAVFAAEKST